MIPKYYEFICPVKILSGRLALANLPYEMTQLNSQKALIITDKGVVGAGLLKKVKKVFENSDREIGAIYEDTPPDSSNHVCNEVAKLYAESGSDCIVALGGGSVLDTAKGVNIVVSEGTDDLLKFQGVDRISMPMQPSIAIPTTAGTGSEVTAAAIIANVDVGVKMAFMSNKLYPDVAIIDPVMTMTVPAKITAATGMDALTHALEASYCLQKNPVSDAFAAKAIQLIMENLLECVENGSNEKARMAMANAALLAGIAFSNSMVGMVHSLAHACGGVAHVPHGVANGVLLSYGMEYNIDKVPEYLADCAKMLGVNDNGLSDKELALKGIQKVRELLAKLKDFCGHPTTLKEAGVKEEQLTKIAKVAINDGSLTYNPEEVDAEDALAVLKKAFNG